LLIHIPIIGDTLCDNTNTAKNQGDSRSVCDFQNDFRPECSVSSASATYTTVKSLRENTLEAVIEVRNDNRKDIGGVRIMYGHKSAKSGQACFAHSTNLAKSRYEAGFARKNKGPQISCPNLQKVDF